MRLLKTTRRVNWSFKRTRFESQQYLRRWEKTSGTEFSQQDRLPLGKGVNQQNLVQRSKEICNQVGLHSSVGFIIMVHILRTVETSRRHETTPKRIHILTIGGCVHLKGDGQRSGHFITIAMGETLHLSCLWHILATRARATIIAVAQTGLFWFLLYAA